MAALTSTSVESNHPIIYTGMDNLFIEMAFEMMKNIVNGYDLTQIRKQVTTHKSALLAFIAFLTTCNDQLQASDHVTDAEGKNFLTLEEVKIGIDKIESNSKGPQPLMHPFIDKSLDISWLHTLPDGSIEEDSVAEKNMSTHTQATIPNTAQTKDIHQKKPFLPIKRRWLRTLPDGAIEEISEAELEEKFPKPDLTLYPTHQEKNKVVEDYMRMVAEAGHTSKPRISPEVMAERTRKTNERIRQQEAERKEKQ